ncbi:nuclear transport factor 2 family protein [Flavobacterium sp. ANB]|uniref:nuclear transport factor 2 family protein n=1 Tax=unclassified Flavobacterium TaxID=196869 RepID=UPI0012B6E558|nr:MULTISPECIES: nuclear transport factor 2 family protein [unclassified Flavobacterium]MBF4515827.1 nuclear transport factor 2 family protein [Flavobacterium sp. ANB]MTD68830.1 nuclear transport factor 2 family protein [Flavobacterium sp. LC2016-13]
MNIYTFINDWIEAGNTFDTSKYLNFYLVDAVLDDPSVGRKFLGHEGIKDYFKSYFIGYNTHTEIVSLNISEEDQVYLEVKFTGNFPEGEIGGTFEITFKNNKISYLKADLIH